MRKLRPLRGTTAQNDAYTGSEGEITLDLDKKSIRLHDGVTPGGKKISSGISGTWDMTGGPNCTYALNASEIEILAVGAAGRPVLSNGNQTATRTIDNSTYINSLFIAAPSGVSTATAATIAADVGTKSLAASLTVPDITSGSVSSVGASISLYPVGGLVPVISVQKTKNSADSFNLIRVARNGVSVGSISSTNNTEIVTVVLDSGAGTFKVKVGGSEITLSNNTYTPQELIGALAIVFDGTIDISYTGEDVEATLLTNALDVPDLEGTDICGGVGDAALPSDALPGDILEVTATGTYDGTSFVSGDLAIVRSDGISVTRLPLASINVTEATVVSTATSALAITNHEAEFDPHPQYPRISSQETSDDGAIIELDEGVTVLYLTAVSLVATQEIDCTNLRDGERLVIYSENGITALTISGGTILGTLTTLSAGGIGKVYRAGTNLIVE